MTDEHTPASAPTPKPTADERARTFIEKLARMTTLDELFVERAAQIEDPYERQLAIDYAEPTEDDECDALLAMQGLIREAREILLAYRRSDARKMTPP